MDALIGVAGIVLAAAITPGPNNFVVMDAATRHGLAGAVPAIVGVLLGSAALITVVLAGAAWSAFMPKTSGFDDSWECPKPR